MGVLEHLKRVWIGMSVLCVGEGEMGELEPLKSLDRPGCHVWRGRYG